MNQLKKVPVPASRAMKGAPRVGMITAYDFPSARVADAAGADVILVGDSLGMVVLGYPDTLQVTVEDMLHHTRAAARSGRYPPRTGRAGDLACRWRRRRARPGNWSGAPRAR